MPASVGSKSFHCPWPERCRGAPAHRGRGVRAHPPRPGPLEWSASGLTLAGEGRGLGLGGVWSEGGVKRGAGLGAVP